MPYIFLFIIIFIFLGFSLVFQWLLKDSLSQLYIVGLALFYALCTLIRRPSPAAVFIGNITNGWALIIYEFSLLLSVWCAVAYTMTIIQDNRFRTIMGLCMMTELLAFIITVVLRHYDIHFYLQIFFVSILVIGGFSVIIGIVYMILNWRNIIYHNKVLLIATFGMIGWFMSSLILNLQATKYVVYVCGTGVLLYFLVYITVSALRLKKQIAGYSNSAVNEIIYSDKPHLLQLTPQEKRIITVMTTYNVTVTKDILSYISSDVSENGINSTLSRLMKKNNILSRNELIDIYKPLLLDGSLQAEEN